MTECVIQSIRTLEIVYRVQIWVSRSDYAFIHVLLKEPETEAILDSLSFEMHKLVQLILASLLLFKVYRSEHCTIAYLHLSLYTE